MPSTASTRLRVELQAAGENLNTWGDTRLNEALKRLEEAIADVTTKALTGNVTLTSSNFVADEARAAVLIFTDGGLSAAPTVTIPAVEKWYWVVNQTTYAISIGPASATLATVRAGTTVPVYCDGTNAYAIDPTLDKIKAPAAAVSMNSQKITNLAAPTDANDAARKTDLDAVTAAVQADADAAAASAAEAATSETNAATSATAAAAALDAFDDRYLGSKSSDPTVDNDGNALITGALYWNSVDNEMRTYNGSAWVATFATVTLAGTATGDIDMDGNAITNVGQSNSPPNALTFGSTVTPDLALGNFHTLTATGTFTLAAPSNPVAGQGFVIRIAQDATGSRLWSLASFYEFAGGTVPALSTAANAVDWLVCHTDYDAGSAVCQLLKDAKR